jgi:hypothetical protein
MSGIIVGRMHKLKYLNKVKFIVLKGTYHCILRNKLNSQTSMKDTSVIFIKLVTKIVERKS